MVLCSLRDSELALYTLQNSLSLYHTLISQCGLLSGCQEHPFVKEVCIKFECINKPVYWLQSKCLTIVVSYPHLSAWIASARLEEVTGKLQAARNTIMREQRCVHAARSSAGGIPATGIRKGFYIHRGHRKALRRQSIEGQAIVREEWPAPPMLCLLRAFRRPWHTWRGLSQIQECQFQFSSVQFNNGLLQKRHDWQPVAEILMFTTKQWQQLDI